MKKQLDKLKYIGTINKGLRNKLTSLINTKIEAINEAGVNIHDNITINLFTDEDGELITLQYHNDFIQLYYQDETGEHEAYVTEDTEYTTPQLIKIYLNIEEIINQVQTHLETQNKTIQTALEE